jgi:hypothetical protein
MATLTFCAVIPQPDDNGLSRIEIARHNSVVFVLHAQLDKIRLDILWIDACPDGRGANVANTSVVVLPGVGQGLGVDFDAQ